MMDDVWWWRWTRGRGWFYRRGGNGDGGRTRVPCGGVSFESVSMALSPELGRGARTWPGGRRPFLRSLPQLPKGPAVNGTPRLNKWLFPKLEFLVLSQDVCTFV